MNELMSFPTIGSTDPDDLAVALATLLRMRGHDAQILVQMKGSFAVAVEVALGERVVASFPCAPAHVPSAYAEAMNRIVELVPKGDASRDQRSSRR